MNTTKRWIGLWQSTLAALVLGAIAPGALSDVTLPGNSDLLPATTDYRHSPFPLTSSVQSVHTETGMAAWPSGASGSMFPGGGDIIGRLPFLPPELHRSPTWTQFAPRGGASTGATTALHYDIGPLSVAGISASQFRHGSLSPRPNTPSDRGASTPYFPSKSTSFSNSLTDLNSLNSLNSTPGEVGLFASSLSPATPPANPSYVPASPVASSSSVSTFTPGTTPAPARARTSFSQSPDDQDSLTLAVGITIFGSMLIAAFWLMRSPGWTPPSPGPE